MYAIWLTFSKNDREYLKKFIDEISEKYHAPKFEPHITVYGLVDLELKFIDDVVKQIAQDNSSFFIEKSEILYSNELWKTIYIELKINEKIELIHKNLKKHFEYISKYTFKPHISLIYKILSVEEKTKIINKLNVKNEFRVNSLAIQKFFPDVEKWKIVKEYSLV